MLSQIEDEVSLPSLGLPSVSDLFNLLKLISTCQFSSAAAARSQLDYFVSVNSLSVQLVDHITLDPVPVLSN